MGLTGFNRARREAAETKSENPIKPKKPRKKEPDIDDKPLEDSSKNEGNDGDR